MKTLIMNLSLGRFPEESPQFTVEVFPDLIKDTGNNRRTLNLNLFVPIHLSWVPTCGVCTIVTIVKSQLSDSCIIHETELDNV